MTTDTAQKARGIFLAALMVVSVFAGTVALSGAAAAQQVTTADRTLSSSTVQPGDTVEVTVDVTLNESSGVQITDTFDSSLDATIVDGLGSLDNTGNDEVTFNNPTGSASSYSVTYEVTVPTNAADGTNYNFDGTANPGTIAIGGDSQLTVEADGTTTPTPTPPASEIQRGDDGTWDPSEGEGTVGNGATLYQGEDDVTFVDNGNTIPLTDFERSSGSNEGVQLEDPIPTDQTTGSYDDGAGNSVSVSTPRITDHEFRLGGSDGADISGGTVPADENTLVVWAEYNYANAEDLEVSVLDESGLEVTGEVLGGNINNEQSQKGGIDSGPEDEVMWTLNLDNLDDGEEYTIELEGVDDLDYGDAARSDTFSISSEDDVSVNLEQTEVVQGTSLTYDIEGATEGDYHVVRVNANDVKEGSDASNIFRNVGDTASTGVDNGYAWALVEIDGGVGTGGINTAALSDTDVDVEVTENVAEGYSPQTGTPVDQLEELDTATLTVNEGEVSLENPSGFYVPGSEVTLNGTADEGIDEVSFWARDQGAYERVQINGQDTISTTGEEFEAEDVVLSESGGAGGNDILSLPGTYRFAVVAEDPAAGSPNPNRMTTTQVARNISDTTSLRVTESDLEASATIINGMVAEGDLIDVEGAALGSDDVSVSFYGPRGNYDRVGGINVDNDGTFEEEDISVGGHIQPINQGTVIMSVYSDGRDNTVGDGQISGYADFNALIQDIVANQYTQQQVIDRISSETTEDTGSDDLSVAFQFRHTDAQTTVDEIVGEEGVSSAAQVGNDITVSGTTNRQPEDNAITVEAIDGPSSSEFPVQTTEDWGTDGQWNVTLNTTGLEPGNYTIEADDGDSSDVMAFTLSEDAVSEQTPTPTETEEPTETATEEPTETATEAPATDTATETEGDTGPGFGVVVALIALVAAALLAVRRNN